MHKPLIEWRPEFALGIDDVDHEHQEMIELINTLYAELIDNQQQDSVLDFLGEINARIGAHFALEERMMRDRKYDHYLAHKADHERLLDDIRDIMDDYEDGELLDTQDLAKRLTDWFVIHFKTMDARLHKHLG